MLAEENHSCLRRQSHDVAMNRAVWSPASPRCRALCVCGMNTGVQTLLEKLPGLSWKTTVPVSHTQTQCSDMREGHTLKWTTASTFFFFFCKAFSLPSITGTEQASRNKMFGAHSDMFKAKGAPLSLKLNVGNYAINTLAFSVVQVICWGYV